MTINKQNPLSNSLSAFEEAYQLSKKINEAVEESRPIMEEFNKQTHALFFELAAYGWYINGSAFIDELVEIKKQLHRANRIELNILMISQIKQNYQSLKNQTIVLFNGKKEILERGFGACENGQYEYSILIFLTQIDSICEELTGSILFGRSNKQTKTKKFTEAHYDEKSFYSALLQPLANCGEINKSEMEFTEGDFNRHKIIHGGVTNFGNELNCYKMLSLVFYLTTIVKDSEKLKPVHF